MNYYYQTQDNEESDTNLPKPEAALPAGLHHPLSLPAGAALHLGDIVPVQGKVGIAATRCDTDLLNVWSCSSS